MSGENTITEFILAVVAPDAKSAAGGAPIFIVPDADERKRIALYVSKILNAMVHDLENGTYVIVKH